MKAKKPNANLSYHEAASLERKAILRKVRRELADPGWGTDQKVPLNWLKAFIEGRVKRFRKKEGGL